MHTGEHFHGKPVDLWACGVTLYMFVYGRVPFLAKTVSELYGRIQVSGLLYTIGSSLPGPDSPH